MPKTHAQDDQVERFERALQGFVSRSLRKSIHTEPHLYIQALMPGLLPAMRRMTATLFNEVVESVERILEKSFSIESMGWRITALRTGKSYAEIALLHSLVYRVEQVFLIQYETGLLLAKRASPNAYALEAEATSGMVTALLDFMRDAFRAKSVTASGTLRYNEYTVWIERGETMIVAAFFKGMAPFELREILRKTLLYCEQHFSKLLSDSTRSPELEREASEALQPCLISAFKEKEAKSKAWYGMAFVLVIIPPLVLLAIEIRSRVLFGEYHSTLKEVPEIVITETHRGWNSFSFEGLNDLYSISPESALRNKELRLDRVALHFQTYFSPQSPRLFKRIEQFKDQVEDSKVFFERQRADLTPTSLKAISTVAHSVRSLAHLADLSHQHWSLLVVGHADHSGGKAGNLELSFQRAETVRDELVRRLGTVYDGSIRYQGLGESERNSRVVTFKLTLGHLQEE